MVKIGSIVAKIDFYSFECKISYISIQAIKITINKNLYIGGNIHPGMDKI